MNKIFKKTTTIVMVVVMSMVLFGCTIESSATQKESEATKELMNEIANQIGMPNTPNYSEKKLAKRIFEMRDDANLITYAYTQNLNGKYVFLGTCIGYGLPYSVQYTNPQYIADSYSQGGYAVLPQADPNGLYMPEGLSATWLVLVDEETGEQSINYIESEITVTQSKLPRRLVEEWSLPSNY